MKIQAVNHSRIDQVDFDSLSFGTVFTDHMFICHYKDGAWQEPEIKPYGPLEISPSMSSLHYGQAVFEGMKAYKDEADQIFLFRPDQNFERINRSAKRLAIPEFPKDYFFEGLHQLLQMDAAWIPKGVGNSLYIRPFVFGSEACVQASPSKEYIFMIICAPVQKYYGGEVSVLIADRFSRAADGGVGFAKAAGNYGAQFYPTQLAQEEGYQQIIWTDANTHQQLEEAGTMNIFFRINDQLITAPTNDRILDGVTRKSIIQVAKDMGVRVEERPLTVQELTDSAADGSLQEIFGTGTAVVILQIKGFAYKGQKFELQPQSQPLAVELKEKLTNIQYNLSDDPYGWRVPVK
ncbi:MAG: branched-chain amino acid aminotransferase [Flavobacteriaceae bacterium]